MPGLGIGAGLALSICILVSCVVQRSDSFAHGVLPAGIILASRRCGTCSSLSQSMTLGRGQDAGAGDAAASGSGSSSSSKKRVFIFGVGYMGYGLVRAAQAKWGDGVEFFGTCRSEAKAGALRNANIIPHIFNPDDEYKPLEGVALADLMSATHIVTTIPAVADFDRDPVLAFHAADMTRSANLHWAGYISTTGVYGDHQGAWVDETAATLIPPNHRSFSRLEAERAWTDLGPNFPSHIFRLAGIYGPGRSALDTVRRAEASKLLGLGSRSSGSRRRRGYKGDEEVGDKYVSRCHVSDICSVLFASMERPAKEAGRVYNVGDDEPARRRDVMRYARKLLGVRGEEGEEEEGGEREGGGGAGGREENKRVANGRLKQELGVELRYPTYKEGLDAIYAGVTDPFVT